MFKPLLFIKNILLSVNKIHENKIAHLDLKPCNILINDIDKLISDRYDDFVIIDFGCSQIVKNESSIVMNKQSASEGFSPPEISDMKFGIKSDIWALGIIFYLILVRKFYFEANIQDIFYSKINRQVKITKHLNNLWHHIIPNSKNSESEIKNYIYPFTLKSSNYLLDFFKKIFIFDYDKRLNSQQLLNHKIFSLVVP